MSGDNQAVVFLYLLLCLVLVGSAFMARRMPVSTSIKMLAAWALIFLAAFMAFTLKDDFIALGKRIVADGSSRPVTRQDNETLRIRISDDGHYWVNARLNGEEMRFLVDSGATVTSLSSQSAQRAGVEPSGGFPVMVNTANGTVMVTRGRARTLEVGLIKREGLAVHISDTFGDTNVLGMNFLSSLSAWGVEGDWLVLKQ